MHPLETYLKQLQHVRLSQAGVAETSYYTALSNLLNETGKLLKPKVLCVLQLANTGAGNPDGGLYTADQFDKRAKDKLQPGQLPARGAIEVKSTGDDAFAIARGKQVSKYCERYGQVLVTNYRDFVLVARDSNGQPEILESYRLAETEPAFWSAAATYRATAQRHGERFLGYLQRIMLHNAVLASPRDLAWFLASYARDAKARIEAEGAGDLPALAAVREALEEALGLKFEGQKGEHFFRSSLVQTLFYGVFSAWVLWSRQNPPNTKSEFDWRTAAFYLQVPMIAKLFHLVADPHALKNLGLDEVLDWTGTVLNRVDRRAFFDKFQESHAVQYFYEPFLEAFDPELRKQLGVWYTPPEIVKYMVERVDTVLREELNLPDGLADRNVYVLDPCCGTGSFLVEVLDRIQRNLAARGGDALLAHDLKEAARHRVFGFEIMPAPFVVSHLQLGLYLQNAGAPLSEAKHERAGVYLTNALTGWEPPKGPKKHFLFPELEAERDAADEVKRDKPILVVLGNPPYNAFAGVSPAEEAGLVEPYKEGLIKEWGIKKFNLDDLYVRFFRLAERRIAEMTGVGVVSFISNHSWVSEPSFVVLRQHLFNSFDQFWIENMHGNRKISEYAPDGRTSETVFAIPGFSPGIQQGVAISLWLKRRHKSKPTDIHFRDDLDAARATDRRAQLLESLNAKSFGAKYKIALPSKENRYSFRPQLENQAYLKWPKLTQLAEIPPSNGLMEKRNGALIDIDRAALEHRMRKYFDTTVTWEELKAFGTGLTADAARFDAKKARKKLLATEKFQRDRLLRYTVRPFDVRYAYYTTVRPLWNEPRPSLWRQYFQGNAYLMCRPTGVAKPEGVPFFFTTHFGDNDFLRGHAYYFPMAISQRNLLRESSQQAALKLDDSRNRANLAAETSQYLDSLSESSTVQRALSSTSIWHHSLAIGYSPAYLSENADGIRQDWPRIPLPDSKELLLKSADLGRQVAALLDTESAVSGVTSGDIRAELKPLGVAARSGGGALREDEHLAVTAGWGHRGKGGPTGGIVMPGRGKLIERAYTAAEREAIASGAAALAISEADALQHLGESTCDVYLNSEAYWQNVPLRVWGYTIGGYQVMKKWLSYRERDILGRPLCAEEVREVRDMARRIAAILLLEPALDANYRAVRDHAFPWPPQ